MHLQTFPIKKSIQNQMTDRNKSDIKHGYAHHSDESDGHHGVYGSLVKEIQKDLAYLRIMESGQKASIGALALAYNYVIMEDGIAYSVRPPLKVPASQLGDNTHGISVCFDGNFMQHGCTKEQLVTGKELFKYLVHEYNLEFIHGHRDVAKMHPGNTGFYATACPGDFFYHHQLPEIVKYAYGRH